MPTPKIKSGRLHVGANFQCGDNVVVEVSEEVIVGDRCVLGDNAYLSGRRIELGNDFFNSSWDWRRLEIGRGRIDEEDAILRVGDRSTFHDNRIDLSARVEIGDDVGLSPEVVIYTHHYWLDPREGWPTKHEPVKIGNRVIVGFRSVILAGAKIPEDCVIGAQSVVDSKLLSAGTVYAGNPARTRRTLPSKRMDVLKREGFIASLVTSYNRSLEYRGYHVGVVLQRARCCLKYRECAFDLEVMELTGNEDEFTDDLRDYLFKHGLRFYTQRPFAKLPRRLK